MKDQFHSSQTSKYDYSKLVATAKHESQYKDFPEFIRERIDNYRIKYCDGEVHPFTRQTLAQIIGIEFSTLTKIINGSQRTRKRDVIIALCFALKLSISEANQALDLYPMTPLNRNCLRDLIIEQALGDKLSIPDLNDVLEMHGLPKLDILRCKKDKKDDAYGLYYPIKSKSYEEVSVTITPYSVFEEDASLSLHDRYRPDRFDFHSEMILRKIDTNGPSYRIELDDIDYYTISVKENNEWNLLYSNDPFDLKWEHLKPCEDPELLSKITVLKEYTDRKARYIHCMCNDTRNYGSRFDAVNDQGKITIYGEGFNYDSPELSEYYQIEISSDGFIFTVSNTSIFLYRYLGLQKWKRLYNDSLPSINQRFTSLEAVNNSKWSIYFQSLLDSAKELLGKIQNRELFLSNARALYAIDDLMHLYQVEEAFECTAVADIPFEIIPQKDQIIGPDGDPVTVDDLYRAAELDIFSLEELCNIRSCYGSLENILHIAWLTEQKGNNHDQ